MEKEGTKSSNQTDFTTKYIIVAEFRIKGVVEKSDIVGAIFGQTEGLLLDLDLRDLQKSGRIGRIEVDHESKEGVSNGVIKIPSSLTRKETALLAATVETVTRVGPCEAEIKLKDILDIRETKRKQIIERAAVLLKEWDTKSLEPSEIEEQIDTDIKLGEITEWGPDKLPAGPEIENSSEIIVVEGRADVLNLLRIGVKNSIAVQGTQVPKSIIELTKAKSTVTAFLDGDRGGTIILNQLLQMAKLDFVARAPEGYEVEELTRKQLIKALQNKKPISDFKEVEKDKEKEKPDTNSNKKTIILKKILKKMKIKDTEILVETIENLVPGHAVGFNKKLNKLFEIPVAEIFEKLRSFNDVVYIVIDGILTNRLLTISINMKIKFIACKNKEEKLKIPENLSIFYF